jgi:hypothetical protein
MAGLAPQAGLARLAALDTTELGHARALLVGLARLAALDMTELGQARAPMPFTSLIRLLMQDVDARDAHGGEKSNIASIGIRSKTGSAAVRARR